MPNIRSNFDLFFDIQIIFESRSSESKPYRRLPKRPVDFTCNPANHRQSRAGLGVAKVGFINLYATLSISNQITNRRRKMLIVTVKMCLRDRFVGSPACF